MFVLFRLLNGAVIVLMIFGKSSGINLFHFVVFCDSFVMRVRKKRDLSVAYSVVNLKRGYTLS